MTGTKKSLRAASINSVCPCEEVSQEACAACQDLPAWFFSHKEPEPFNNEPKEKRRKIHIGVPRPRE